MFTKEFYVQAVLGLLYALIPTGIIVDALGYALFCWPWYLHAIIVLLIVIAGLLVLLWRRRLYPFRNLKMTDLVPYIIEERKVKKSYEDNQINLDICETITVKKISYICVPISIVLAKFPKKNSSRNLILTDNTWDFIKIVVVRQRAGAATLLSEGSDYLKQINPRNGKREIFIEIKQHSLLVNDVYIITASNHIATEGNDSMSYIVASNASTYGIKKIILEWTFPESQAFDNVGLKVINKYYCRVQNNTEYQNYTIDKEVKRVLKQNKIKDTSLPEHGSITINNPVKGLTYRIKGEKYIHTCSIE